MTPSTPGTPRRSHARSNNARILAAARQELARDPDVSLDDIARAAGVVRRTLYGHFPNRQALVSALADEAKQALGEAFTAARRPGADPPAALARLILATWAVGDRYRMLISLARRDLGEDRIRAALAPARAEATAILERGQRDGIFARHLPAPILALANESAVLAVLESQSPGWSDPTGEAAATTVLIAAGLAPDAARRHVRAALGPDAAGGSPVTGSAPARLPHTAATRAFLDVVRVVPPVPGVGRVGGHRLQQPAGLRPRRGRLERGQQVVDAVQDAAGHDLLDRGRLRDVLQRVPVEDGQVGVVAGPDLADRLPEELARGAGRRHQHLIRGR